MYDTLVRAGALCRSVFVGEHDARVTEAHVATCSRGVRIIADAALADVSETQTADILVIPGGAQGAKTLSQNTDVQELVRKHLNEDKIVGMICAGSSLGRCFYQQPLTSACYLGSLTALTAGLPKQPLTSFPTVKAELEKGESVSTALHQRVLKAPKDFEYREDPVVVSGRLVTR